MTGHENNRPTYDPQHVSRRKFLTRTSLGLAGATAAMNLPFVHTAFGAGDSEIKIGLIGCGGRGTGAILDAIGAATNVIYPATGYHTEDVADDAKVETKNIQVMGLADLFEDRLAHCRTQLGRLGIDVPQTRCFTGFDAYEKMLAEPQINYVILATPPHFRPQQLKAAIEAGKHVFLEKPAAVDVPGVKTVIEAGELAQQKGLGIAAGTQRRHIKSYQETIRRLQDGAIGEILYGKCYWNGGQIWVIPREEGWSDLEWQLRNWNYFTWLSGDHIVEQHVHNLDVMNWVLGTHPIRAVSGLGGHQCAWGRNTVTSTTTSQWSSNTPTTSSCSASADRSTAARISWASPSQGPTAPATAKIASNRSKASRGDSGTRTPTPIDRNMKT